jgi:hypothetical protein
VKVEKPPRRKKERNHNSMAKLIVLILVVLPLSGAFYAVTSVTTLKQSVKMLQVQNTQLKASNDRLTATTSFPLQDAETKAIQLATECFTVDNGKLQEQQQRLQSVTGVGDCGWDGLGTGSTISTTVDLGQSTVQGDKAIIAVDVRLYLNPHWFTYYVSFKRDASKLTATVVGAGAIFGLNAHPTLNVFAECNPGGAVSSDVVKQLTASASALVADPTNPNVPTAPGITFGGYNSALKNPHLGTLIPCVSPDGVQYFRASFQFDGPVLGAHYTQWYAFAATPANTGLSNQHELIKAWGPDPLGGKQA